MNNHHELVTWLRKMGFTEDIPDSFVDICNKSTLFIWEQLMQNVIPKKEAENIKKNIVLHRLQQKDLNRQNEFIYKMKIVELYRKKLDLENKLSLLRDTVQEKDIRIQRLSQNSKVKELTIDFLKKKISQNKQRKYLLDLKTQHLEKQNYETEEMLDKLINATPLEVELSSSTKDISETVEKCSEKLTKIIKKNLEAKQNTTQHGTYNTNSKKRKPADMSSIASYMAIREREDFQNMSISLVNKLQSKEYLMPPNMSHKHGKENIMGISEVSLKVPKTQTDKRESLGILHDSFIKNDSFSDLSKTFLSSNKPDDNSNDNVFMNTQDNIDPNNSVISTHGNKNKSKLDSPKIQNYSDDETNLKLNELLRLSNRNLVYNAVQKNIDEVKLQFSMIASVPNCSQKNIQRDNEDNVAKLQAIHIQNELKIIQQKGILKIFLNNIATKRAQILETIGQENEEHLDLAIKQVKTDASLTAIKKEINSPKWANNNEEELEIIHSKIFKIKNEIGSKTSLLQLSIEELNKVHADIFTIQGKASSRLWNLLLLKEETKWMEPMLENRWVTEIDMFEHFPLEYQRQCKFTDKKTFYRDLCIDNYSEIEKMSHEDLQMLCTILESTLSPPEIVLANIIKEKEKLEFLKSFKKKTDAISTKNYSFEELRQQESYLSYAIDSLKTIMSSSKASKTLAVADSVEQSMKIWLEMPIKYLISDKRLVDGQTYQFYEEKLKYML
ncbi:hypothetical protein GWI33_021012 [Rhynchophorus ferrugineus]|uniref:Uncharacterized protein n=1 Tax=Rhynchophorus ferrugineus TaxID=354439 RepID=A0A834LZZ7_RHYFE|nr:hypothetical protein GWI33_021012 [Rhynchophorus ferrugineus]